VALLRERDVEEDVLDAIMGHAPYTGVARESRLAKTLFAVDELCGLIVAAALVRPDGLTGMKPKSIKKKMKDKAFARGVNREDIRAGAEALGVDLTEHIAVCIEALQGIREELKI
jgi:predicted hydrolase (HD superfamily)